MVFIIHKNYFCLALNFGLVLLITYTLPRLLTSLELRSLFLIDFNELFIFIINAGNDLLFQVLRLSTIGAEGLDFRVRNGIGYNTFAIITGVGFILKNNIVVKPLRVRKINNIYLNNPNKFCQLHLLNLFLLSSHIF